jgi:hypothetical protein
MNKVSLGSLTAVVALAVPALGAGPLTITIDQEGSTQNAAISQTGGSGNLAGDDTHPIQQLGVYNTLTITQTGNDNLVGLAYGGLVQTGTASDDGSFSNSAVINQISDGNALGALTQTSADTHATTSNVLAVDQNTGDRNTIGSITQVQQNGGAQNQATLIEAGRENWIESISQRSGSAGDPNQIDLELRGNDNGITGTLDGPSTLDVLALSAGARSGMVVQDLATEGGAGNVVKLTVTGDYNQFGIEQRGTRNVLGPITISGLKNSLGTYQMGSANVISMGGIAGDSNDAGIRQIGTANSVTLSLIDEASDNKVGIGQTGTANTADLTIDGNSVVAGALQSGYRNKASLTITGDDNVVLGVQANADSNTSAGNTMTVSVTGRGNNDPSGPSGGFTGIALAAAAAAPTVTGNLLLAPDASLMLSEHELGLSLQPGLLVQWGDADRMTITVGSVARPGDGNAFAAYQGGARNTLTAEVYGQQNQFVVVQASDGNDAELRQDGTANIAVIMQ